jgi:AraC family ethanolamine operon transcriptional activator
MSSPLSVPAESAPVVIQHVSTDPDEIQEVARAWDLDFRPMVPPRGESRLFQTVDHTALIGFAHIDPRVEQRGASPPNMRTFALPGRQVPEVVWCGAPTGRDSLMCFDAGGDFEASSPSGFQVHTLSVEVAHLDALASSLGLGSVDRLGSSAQTIPLEPQQAEALRVEMERLTAGIAQDPTTAGRRAVRDTLEIDLASSMLRAAIGGLDGFHPPGASRRKQVLRRALDFIDAHAARAPRVSELCRVAGASERTLRYAFQDRFGMSPKSYLQAVRLNGVRRELRKRQATTISDAANRWGFWHMGQFAADYHGLFGELPSQTVAQAMAGQRGRATRVSVRGPSSAQRRL